MVALLVAWSVPAASQTRIEGQVQGEVVAASTLFAGAGVGLGIRPYGRSRAGVTFAVGSADRRLAGRAEATVSYHVNPFARRGIVPYVVGGVAVQTAAGDWREYLLVALGVEIAPAGRRGAFAEIGLAGGVRAVVGWRVRTRGR